MLHKKENIKCIFNVVSKEMHQSCPESHVLWCSNIRGKPTFCYIKHLKKMEKTTFIEVQMYM